MSLPLSILSRFNSSYDGLKAAVFASSSEYHNFTVALREAGVSFKTKITKHKKRGREFVVMLLQKEAVLHFIDSKSPRIHDVADKTCWCNPEIHRDPSGAYLIYHRDDEEREEAA